MCGGVMVLVARFVRVAARFGQAMTFTLELKVRHFSPYFFSFLYFRS
jgi:hypothetical protein